ncbi:PucR family transcriptional regulator [Aeromicrobium sp. Root472D3]|uniref:PucR family transcriptional regulator n=1 Tax=Aeromicrobium sp. Root472D3 TaxID=1736540 RepID=UPI0009E79140|nr:PucR family transcriptional regulator [Aeromicrobium sp. Root472D3]
MPLTLRSILDLDVVADGDPLVLAGGDALDRIVRWVHVTEVDDVASVLGGSEVVLTTGLPLVGPTADPARFLEQLSAAGACGLVVELADLAATLPQDVVDEAERQQVPLVVLRRPVRFVSITEAVHRLIVGEQYQGLAFAQRTHEVFTALSLDIADAQTIVSAAADLIDLPVVLEDLTHRVLALAPQRRPQKSLLLDWDERSRRSPTRDEPGPWGADRWVTCRVGVRGAPWGRLVIPEAVDDPTREALVLQRAAQALQISRLVERDTESLQFRAQESLLLDLTEGRLQDEDDGVAQARALGMPAAALYLPVAVMFESAPTTASDKISGQRRTRAHLDTVSRALREARVDGFAGGFTPGGVGVIVALGRTTPEDATLTRLAAALDRLAPGRPGSRGPVVGVGRPAPQLLVAASRMRTTVNIAQAARAMPVSDLGYFRSTDVRIRGLVAQLQDDERLLAFAESELGPLLSLAPAPQHELLDLLRAYVGLRGNKTALAHDVGISRQALYGRLRKLESMLMVDLDDSDSFISLSLALLVHDYRSTLPTPPR